MHGFVVDVRTQTLGDIEAIAFRLACLTEMLLFIANVMLCACNDSCVLNASNRGVDQGASQIWVGAKSLLRYSSDTVKAPISLSTCPVPAPFGRTA